ncbi:MAG TPA: transcriptional regulator [Firmicutes bacterium]|nr:transcriptional regulator [Bacillota bacterium]
MTSTNYFKQIVNSYLKQNALNETSLCLSENITQKNLGEIICAMANTAALEGTPYVYAFWGIDKETKALINTDFIIPNHQEIAKHLSTNTEFLINELILENNRVVVLEVQRAYGSTIQYDGVEFILKNNQAEKIDCCPTEANRLWDIIYSGKEEDFSFKIALKNVSADEVAECLDWKKLFEMLQKPLPNSPLGVMSVLCDFRFIREQNTGKYDITNLGALLLAKRLSKFKNVEYKAIRVLIYSGNNYTKPAHEQIGGKGYIIGFEGLIKYIDEHLPQTEYMDGPIRKKRSMFPILSVRELVANALIHQDLNEKGSPIISIFEDHIVISNPGIPVVEKNRFIDSPPHSRNESLAAAMHRVGICEERGSGYDKVITYIEENNLPAPEITIHDKSTSVTLWNEKPFNNLTKDELVQICYDHSCLNYVQGKVTNNFSLRTRFKLSENERYKVSRIFKLTSEAGLIKAKDGTGPKNREYVPFWVE